MGVPPCAMKPFTTINTKTKKRQVNILKIELNAYLTGPSSVLVTTSKALVTSSDALVTTCNVSTIGHRHCSHTFAVCGRSAASPSRSVKSTERSGCQGGQNRWWSKALEKPG